ncbi:hypothetical protein P2G88_18005 [Aliiglaciecola sp. CAU 1673]|uniref:hypothetical protein n=1 Tax=Aliiglaciecola sp. CAU 1673 TaxID=3032595 RepID=UPI0023DBB1D1|nr:hypothetical protein [Aliiglaciecola sp. CAU 1673]MDF2180153.1 hypothetical protein [Aliiglaciecola sp. CAU 1673]
MQLRLLFYVLLVVTGALLAINRPVPSPTQLHKTPSLVSFKKTTETLRNETSEYIEALDFENQRYRFYRWLPNYTRLLAALEYEGLWELQFNQRDRTVYGATFDGQVLVAYEQAVAAEQANNQKYQIAGVLVAIFALWQLYRLFTRKEQD